MKNTNNSEAKVVSTSEAARILDVSPATLLSVIEAGELPAIRIGHRYKISRATIDRLLGEEAA